MAGNFITLGVKNSSDLSRSKAIQTGELTRSLRSRMATSGWVDIPERGGLVAQEESHKAPPRSSYDMTGAVSSIFLPNLPWIPLLLSSMRLRRIVPGISGLREILF